MGRACRGFRALMVLSLAVIASAVWAADAPGTATTVRKIALWHADARDVAAVFGADDGQDAFLVQRDAPADAHVRAFAPTGAGDGALPDPQTNAGFLPAKQRQALQARSLLPDGIVAPPVAYARDNSLIVRGTERALDELAELVVALDVPPRQVKVRATVISTLARDTEAFQLGWFARAAATVAAGPGQVPGRGPEVRFARANLVTAIGAREAHEMSRVVAEPFVVTSNMHAVDLCVSTLYPYMSPVVEYTPWGARIVGYQVQTVAVGMDLFLVPQINNDDTVRLSIAPVFSEIVGGRTAPDGQVLPVLAANSFATEITVRDGETVCIAGLPRERTSEVSQGSPYMPSLGVERQRERGEILVFVTPEIMREAPTAD